MKKQTLCLAIVVLAILVIMAGGAGAQEAPAALDAAVAGAINYQGRLTDASGTPLTGMFPMRFEVYNVATGGTALWDSGNVNVEVNGGLFNVKLGMNPSLLNGQGLWLRMLVNGEGLTPRQELLPVPYALGLRPGATVEGDATTWTDGWVLNVHMNGAYPQASAIRGTTATGSAVYGNSNGYGLYGYSDQGNAVVGTSNAKTAGVFHSQEGYGIEVSTNGLNHWDHAGYFTSNMGYGIYVTSLGNNGLRAQGGTDLSGVWQPGGPVGVAGLSATRSGVFGSSRDANGVYGISAKQSGVYGQTEQDNRFLGVGVLGYKGSGDGAAVRGQKEGNTGIGVWGTNFGASGSGVAGQSTNWYGVVGTTSRADGNYGLYTDDNLYSWNIHMSGAIMQVAQNSGTESLEPGDVVALTGIATPQDSGGPLVIQVARTSLANSSAVGGVVYSRFAIDSVNGTWQIDGQGVPAGAEIVSEGPVASGEYLLLVVQGPAQVKASAVAGAIAPGDLLSTADQGGYAAQAAEIDVAGSRVAAPGTVLGKALEPLESGQKLIYVFVTLH